MLSKKEIGLLEYLLTKQHHFVSSVELAEAIGVSDRTARKYLKLLGQTIEQHGAHLISKQGNGYMLEIIHTVEFEVFWQETQLSKKTLKSVTQVEESIDRQHYILNKLFFNNEVVLFDDLAQELFVSKTTLMNAINDIRKQVLPYSLEIINDKKGVRVHGVESDIRHFMMDYFFVDTFEDSMFSFVEDSLLDDINFAEISIVVIDECRDARLRLSDYVVHNLVLHIALMIKRIRTGYALSFFQISDDIQKSKEYDVALRILYRLEAAFNINFPIEEANYIALHLKVKQMPGSSELNRNPKEATYLNDEIKAILKKMGKVTDISLENDQTLLSSLIAHFKPLLIRLENNIQLSNPLVDDIKKKYLEVFNLTKDYFSKMSVLEDKSIGDDEWAYIAIHVLAAIERAINRKKLKVLVVCATGSGSAMMLKNRLENEFGGTIKIVDVIGYYEINEERIKGIDLIVSSISLANLLFLTPVIQVSVFLTNEETEEIRRFIRKSPTDQTEINLDKMMGLNKADQIVREMFVPDKFMYLEEPINKMDLLDKMTIRLNEARKPGFKQLMLNQMALRETYSQVVYGDRLAFPHPTRPLTVAEEVVVALLKHPLKWDEEHPEVNFVFLLSPSKGSNEKIRYVSSSLVDFVNDEEAQKRLMENPSFEVLKDIFISLLNK